ncbi:MAG: hypothetical protein RMI94_13250, partial [Bryobacterales bacterium]|nr:hypothetical protein [Bryobacterales bacterium]
MGSLCQCAGRPQRRREGSGESPDFCLGGGKLLACGLYLAGESFLGLEEFPLGLVTAGDGVLLLPQGLLESAFGAIEGHAGLFELALGRETGDGRGGRR